MRVDTPTLREQLLTAVSSATDTPSTSELVDLAPPRVEHREGCYPSWHRDSGLYGAVTANECHGDHHIVTRRRYHHEVYTQLRALEQQGHLERIKDPGARVVRWRPTTAPIPLDALEALWDLPAKDPR